MTTRAIGNGLSPVTLNYLPQLAYGYTMYSACPSAHPSICHCKNNNNFSRYNFKTRLRLTSLCMESTMNLTSDKKHTIHDLGTILKIKLSSPDKHGNDILSTINRYVLL